MPHYLISFNEGAMNHIPEADFPAVGRAAHDVLHEAFAAGVYVFGGGLLDAAATTVVGTDGRITQGPNPARKDFIGGFTIVNVASRDEAHRWAARIAGACRCAQEVREFMPDPERDAMEAAGRS